MTPPVSFKRFDLFLLLIMKLLLVAWISAVCAFAFLSIIILSQKHRINAPGEINEVIGSSAIILFIILLALSSVVCLANFFKNNY